MKKYTFTELLNIPEARELIECIEELIGETECCLVRIRENYITQLAKKYGYQYTI